MKQIFTVFMAMLAVAIALPMSAQDNPHVIQKARTHLQKHATKHQLSPQDMQEYIITDEYTSQGITHVYLRQAYQGIEIFGANAAVHTKNEKVIASDNNFMSNVSSRISQTTPVLSVEEALQSLAQTKGFASQLNLEVIEKATGKNNHMILSGGNISSENIPARLVYVPTKDNNILLSWNVVVTDVNSPDILSVRIDAQTGEILDEQNWTVYCDFGGGDLVDTECTDNHAGHAHTFAPSENTAASMAMAGSSYNVFEYPVESPNHGSRSIVNDPEAANTTASPDGWHKINNTSYTVTRGNNVDAYIDNNDTNSPTGGNSARANGGAALDFDFTWTVGGSQSSYKDAAVTNLFYWSNLIHDVWYNYGFDEASGNFQENNFGRGGSQSDGVLAEAQDGSGTCNANFGTPADGGNPRMQMYLCNNRDGDYDNGVVVHEYGHGISTRLTGGPASSGCLNNQEQMGEGWSDWFGTMMTIEAGDQGTDSRGMGTWLIGEGANGDGIRAYPYSTDMNINPQTYNSIKTAAVPHGVGSVWATMIWDMSWALIDEYGYDADLYNGTGGNNIAMALVIEGLKLQPCSPGFVTGRDAILAADQALYNGANQCLIWEVFARRGLGVNASQGSSLSNLDGTESYGVPSSCDSTPPPSCTDNAVTVTITLDNYPEETSWTLTNGSGATVASSGGTYNGTPDGTTVNIPLCLADGCYNFTINDSYGDGICCSYGNGSYQVTDDATNEVYVSGGQFASTETTEICVGGQTLPPLEYCGSTSNNVSDEWIQRVQIGSIDNNSGSNGGYADFTAQSISGNAGSTFSVIFTPGFASTTYTEYWTMWIDYNRDGDFGDAGETVLSGNGTGALSGSFTVPAGVADGDLRIRVSMKYNAASTPCESFTYGEVEDYTLIIGGNNFAGNGVVFGSTTGKPEVFTHDERGKAVSLDVYPNPVRGNLSVNLNMPAEGEATLAITDLNGKVVIAPIDASATRGLQTINMNTSNLESGIYFVRLVTENEILTKRVVVIK